MSKRPLIFLSLLLLATTTSAAAQQAIALRDTHLRSKPNSDAVTISKIKAKTQLQILQRKGGWYQAQDENKKIGWLRMSHIRLDGGSGSGTSGGGLSQTLNFLSTGRSGASGVTVATGIRGLDSADVSNAKPNHEAVKKLDSYKVSNTNAKKFATRGRLREIKLRYLKEPD